MVTRCAACALPLVHHRAIAERHLAKSFKTLSANPLNFQGAIASYKGPRDGFEDFELQVMSLF